MDKQPLISLCIPTNGVLEWVFPVLDSIYSQNIETSLFEVIVTDNGNNEEFKQNFDEYQENYNNLYYFRSSGYEFLSEPDSYKNANGLFIKFINHRTKLRPGTLQYFINWIIQNKQDKPFVYFSNGVLNKKNSIEVNNFDSFVKELSYFSSWSTGMAFWNEDFQRLGKDTVYNLLFPHTTILFSQCDRNRYIVDDNVLLDEIPQGKIPKGRYNLFNAFAIEYISIINDLLRNKFISLDTFLFVKKQNEKFLIELYCSFILRKKKCSYDLRDYKKSLNVYYNHKNIRYKAIRLFIVKVLKYPMKFFTKFGV